MEYLLALVVIFSVTLLIQHKNKIRVFRSLEEGFRTMAILFFLGVLWDSWAIWRGHWVYPAGKTLGPHFGYMPIEDYLFVLVVPYGVLVIAKYLAIKRR